MSILLLSLLFGMFATCDFLLFVVRVQTEQQGTHSVTSFELKGSTMPGDISKERDVSSLSNISSSVPLRRHVPG